jgi:hypothetical protein
MSAKKNSLEELFKMRGNFVKDEKKESIFNPSYSNSKKRNSRKLAVPTKDLNFMRRKSKTHNVRSRKAMKDE